MHQGANASIDRCPPITRSNPIRANRSAWPPRLIDDGVVNHRGASVRQTSQAEFSEFASSARLTLHRTTVIVVGRQLTEDRVQSASVGPISPGLGSARPTRHVPTRDPSW